MLKELQLMRAPLASKANTGDLPSLATESTPGLVKLSDSYKTNEGAANSGIAPSHLALFSVAKNTGLFFGTSSIAMGDLGNFVFCRYGNIITISTRLLTSVNPTNSTIYYDVVYPGRLYVPIIDCFSFSGVGAIYQHFSISTSGGTVQSFNQYELILYEAANDGVSIYLTRNNIEGTGSGRPVFNVVLPAKYDVDGNALVQL